jgi:hypothetical protein
MKAIYFLFVLIVSPLLVQHPVCMGPCGGQNFLKIYYHNFDSPEITYCFTDSLVITNKSIHQDTLKQEAGVNDIQFDIEMTREVTRDFHLVIRDLKTGKSVAKKRMKTDNSSSYYFAPIPIKKLRKKSAAVGDFNVSLYETDWNGHTIFQTDLGNFHILFLK